MDIALIPFFYIAVASFLFNASAGESATLEYGFFKFS